MTSDDDDDNAAVAAACCEIFIQDAAYTDVFSGNNL